jgi:hypothetical protein
MIIATKTVDSLLKGLVNSDSLMISRLESIMSSIQLDPNISQPKKEMYILSSDDIKTPNSRKLFIESLDSKHQNSIIMFINKTNKEIKELNTNIFDSYLVKPSKDNVKQKLLELVQESENKTKFKQSEIKEEDNFSIKNMVGEIKKEDIKEDNIQEVSITLDLPKEEKVEEVNDTGYNDLLSRIQRTENWASLTTIVSEVSASRIVQEITKANASFRQSENYISSLYENIDAILSNPTYSIETQLSKVRAILHDKAHIKAKTNSIVEQEVEKIIKVIIDKSKEEVERKTKDLDEKIAYAIRNKSTAEADNVRLSTIIEERAKILIELNALDLEIKGLSTICNNTINDTVDNTLSESTNSTKSPILDSQLSARYGTIVPDNILDILDNLFSIGAESNKEFGEMSNAVGSTIRKLYSLLSLYQEENEVLANTIRYLRANNVEDTVLANTILKKTSRLFISSNNFDSITLSYMISKHNSRKNNNVLLVDLTNTDVLDLFGIDKIKYSYFMEREMIEDKFKVISVYGDEGVEVKTFEDYQRLSTKLLQYAKHYSMINIICLPEQKELIESMKEDVLSITYLVDCYPVSINEMKDCIIKSKVDNTAYKVILVNYMNNSSSICKQLNILDRLDIQLAMCDPIKEIRYCSLFKQDPYNVESIIEDCVGVFKIC